VNDRQRQALARLVEEAKILRDDCDCTDLDRCKTALDEALEELELIGWPLNAETSRRAVSEVTIRAWFEAARKSGANTDWLSSNDLVTSYYAKHEYAYDCDLDAFLSFELADQIELVKMAFDPRWSEMRAYLCGVRDGIESTT